MKNYEKYTENIINNIKLLLENKKNNTDEAILNFIEQDKKITAEIQKNKDGVRFMIFSYAFIKKKGKPNPKYLGEEIPITGDGNITNDR